MVGNSRKSQNNGNSASTLSKNILKHIQKKFNLSSPELQGHLKEIVSSLEEEQTIFPISIINNRLTVLESIVKYFKEEKGYSLHSIAGLLRRNEKNLWHAYNSATKKMPHSVHAAASDILVPLDIFSSEKFSPLEAIVVYLKEQRKLSFHDIASLLTRDDRTIWTTYTRAKKKHETKK